MADKVRCSCRRCTINSLMGPAIVITVGILFLLNSLRGGFFSFGNTFPVILIVMGAIKLAAAVAPMDGHIDPNAPPQPPATPLNPPPNSLPGQGTN